MTPKLKIIPLGGLGEIGKNMTVVEFGNDLIIIDCGMGFPDEDMYGIDVVLPDITYLRNNASRIRGMIITHGHEDHIGAVPYVLQELDVPIYTTPLTAALIELKTPRSLPRRPAPFSGSALLPSSLSTSTTASRMPSRWRSGPRWAPSCIPATSRSTSRPSRAA